MFRRCIACNADLGANEALEAFPVGRRLAFDADKGRLWVVCPACKQWNLSPLEERWEAIDAAEKRYRDTKKRVTPDEVGLARAGDGTDLVRIGAPQRPEFAAWRYGARFAARRTRHLLAVGGAAVAGGAVVIGGLVSGVLAIGSWNALQYAVSGTRGAYRRLRLVARVTDADGVAHHVSYATLRRTGIVAGEDGAWEVAVPQLPASTGLIGRLRVRPDVMPVFRLRGVEARRLVSQVLPHVNRAGAAHDDVERAVRRLEGGDSLESLAQLATRQKPNETFQLFERLRFREAKVPRVGLEELPMSHRLALEMALHEDDERRWLEGELDELTDRWREAEEVASIADRLLVPAWVEARLGEGREG